MRLRPDLVLTPEGWRADRAVAITDGRIAAIEAPGAPQRGDVALPGRALLPGTVNSHCHTFQSLLRGLGDDLDFMGWRDRVLYPFSERLDRAGIALGATFAFAEMLKQGATTCVDFFYLQDSGNENAEAVIEAARAVGIRLVLARAMYDWEGAPKRYRETPAEAARRVRELIAAHRHDETVVVQPAPHSPHGASSAMIRAGWEAAESEDTVFHIHVAEGRYEGERTLREHGATPIRYLDRLGVLGPRLIGVHGVWLDEEEVALMGARGAGLAYCPGSNMFLGDGITRLPELLGAGVRVGLHVRAAAASAAARRHRAVGRHRLRPRHPLGRRAAPAGGGGDCGRAARRPGGDRAEPPLVAATQRSAQERGVRDVPGGGDRRLGAWPSRRRGASPADAVGGGPGGPGGGAHEGLDDLIAGRARGVGRRGRAGADDRRSRHRATVWSR